MTSVDQAVLAIREIAQGGNEEQAFQDTQALFFQLVRDNVIFIMPSHTLRPDVFAKRAFRPYMAPLEGEQENLYIRIFCDRKLSARFATEHDIDPTCVAEISGIELIQLAKYWFVRGAFGFLLNDGGEWITISLPDFLQVVYDKLIDQPQKYNQEFVDLVGFVYRCKSVYSKVFLLTSENTQEKMTLDVDGVETYCFVDEQLAGSYPPESGYVTVEVTEGFLKSLILKDGPAHITTIYGMIRTTMEHIRYAYAAAYFPEEV